VSTPAPVLVSGVGTLAVTSAPLPSSNAAQASNSVVVTDSAGTLYPAVVLTGAETPVAWSWAATYASGTANAVVTALDTSGATIGTPLTTTFSVVAVIAATFEQPTSIGFVANTTSAAVAAVHAALKR
jgi:hypothetical protein